jgi:hypothetical protein
MGRAILWDDGIARPAVLLLAVALVTVAPISLFLEIVRGSCVFDLAVK